MFEKYYIRTQGKPKIKAATKILVQQFNQNQNMSKERPEKGSLGKEVNCQQCLGQLSTVEA